MNPSTIPSNGERKMKTATLMRPGATRDEGPPFTSAVPARAPISAWDTLIGKP
jgi:hypothetical protein